LAGSGVRLCDLGFVAAAKRKGVRREKAAPGRQEV